LAYQYVREPLTADEADRLANACKTAEEKLVIWTLLDTGLRVSELCGLRLENISWQSKELRIKGKGGPFGKRTKQRAVPMSNRIRPLLESYFSLKSEWFIGPRQAQKVVKKIADRAMVSREVTPHVLRHTFATLALQKGISLAAVKKALGHDRLSTTEIYLNLTDKHVQEEFERKW
jgi:integrase/recombinase XerD